MSVNDTEARRILRNAGAYAPRHVTGAEALLALLDERPTTQQEFMRRKVQDYVQANWEFFKEMLSCSGNCAAPDNPCADAQAAACYLDNRDKFR